MRFYHFYFLFTSFPLNENQNGSSLIATNQKKKKRKEKHYFHLESSVCVTIMLNIIMNRINSVIVFSVYLLIFIGFNLYPCNAYDGVNVLQHTGTNGTISSNLYSTAASNNNCRSERLAIYKVVLHTYWTRELFPKHYPDWRPPAQWTKTIGEFWFFHYFFIHSTFIVVFIIVIHNVGYQSNVLFSFIYLLFWGRLDLGKIFLTSTHHHRGLASKIYFQWKWPQKINVKFSFSRCFVFF